MATDNPARFYIKLPNPEDEDQVVFVEYSASLDATMKSTLIRVFGLAFVQAEVVRFGDLLKRSFSAKKVDVDMFYEVMKQLANNSIIKSLEIVNN